MCVCVRVCQKQVISARARPRPRDCARTFGRSAAAPLALFAAARLDANAASLSSRCASIPSRVPAAAATARGSAAAAGAAAPLPLPVFLSGSSPDHAPVALS